MSRLALLLVCLASVAPAQRNYDTPFPAHHVIGNTYFVGTEALGSYLIVTPAGNILINTDFERTVPQIKASIDRREGPRLPPPPGGAEEEGW